MEKEDSKLISNEIQSFTSNYPENITDYRKLIIQTVRKIHNKNYLKKIYSFSKAFLED